MRSGERGRDQHTDRRRERDKRLNCHPLDSTRRTDPDNPNQDWMVFQFTLFEKEAASSHKFVIRAHKIPHVRGRQEDFFAE